MTYSYMKGSCILVMLLFLSSCMQRDGLAPVVESAWQSVNTKQQRHVVVRGETLYAIAFRYNQDYRQVASANRLRPPYTLRVGQVVRVQPKKIRPVRGVPSQRNKPVYQSPRVPYHAPARQQQPVHKVFYSQANGRWLWPAKGRVVANFVPNLGKKGIDIAGNKGEKILASAGGIVAYAGSGLAGYGNLIIIKHNNQYLTAYGNNSRNLVREGQQIAAGQAIAEMGVVDRRFWGVHFEIRKAGIPVNPMNYLQKG